MNANDFTCQIFGIQPALTVVPTKLSVALKGWDTPTKEQLKGMYHYEHVMDSGNVVHCYLDYQPSEKQTQWEPGCPASMDLCHALVNGIDILEVINQEDVYSIEDGAMSSMNMDAWNDDYDRAADRAESRSAA